MSVGGVKMQILIHKDNVKVKPVPHQEILNWQSQKKAGEKTSQRPGTRSRGQVPAVRIDVQSLAPHIQPLDPRS